MLSTNGRISSRTSQQSIDTEIKSHSDSVCFPTLHMYVSPEASILRQCRTEDRTEAKKDSCATFRATMFLGTSFIAAGALHIKLIANYVVRFFRVCSFLFANIPRTAWRNQAKSG